MTQGTLLNDNSMKQKKVSIKNINAVCTQLSEKAYEVFREISSNKFVIEVEREDEKFEGFEVVASKSYMNLSQKSVKTLKELTEHLWYRLA